MQLLPHCFMVDSTEMLLIEEYDLDSWKYKCKKHWVLASMK